jgi:hypothetical protein
MSSPPQIGAVKKVEILNFQFERNEIDLFNLDSLTKSIHEVGSAPVVNGDFLYPQVGGCFFNGRHYTQHALERMAPNTPEVIEILLDRAFERMETRALEIKTFLVNTKRDVLPGDLENWWKEFYPKPRGILPAEVEAEIKRPGSTCIVVKTNADGDVITAFRDGEFSLDFAIHERIIKQVNLIGKRMSLFRHNERSVKKNIEEGTGEIIVLKKKRRSQSEDLKEVKEMVIERIARRTRAKTIGLYSSYKSWEQDMLETKKAKKVSKIDISVWKANEAAKKSYLKDLTISDSHSQVAAGYCTNIKETTALPTIATTATAAYSDSALTETDDNPCKFVKTESELSETAVVDNWEDLF